MAAKYYRLAGREAIPCTLLEWADSFKVSKGHVVAQQEVRPGVRVSTAFLGLDHSWGEGPPLLFETMIFGGPHDQYQERCSTWQEAEGQHSQAIKVALRGSEAD